MAIFASEIKRKDMTTITIRENSPQANKFVAYARSLPFAEVKSKRAISLPAVGEAEPEFNLYESLDRAFADVRLMLDGKKKEKTLDELIDELRNNID
jgi:hypothetical protein